MIKNDVNKIFKDLTAQFSKYYAERASFGFVEKREVDNACLEGAIATSLELPKLAVANLEVVSPFLDRRTAFSLQYLDLKYFFKSELLRV